ncbi:DUF6875 domain-containing protein [Catenuloplanes japonicus]|uniref:DUF6875 domain-containing protein n=1 Tax=Catenuloplanes japonicus TaxID=33876 RepID=UPI000526AF83|nr:hypothetical protein [Catenuloplanes japonicus]
MRWLTEFVTQPHPDLGRAGAVCPRLAPALHLGTVWLVAIRVHRAHPDDAVEAGRLLMRVFDALPGTGERSSHALLGFFPDLAATAAAAFIDVGHRLLRPEVAARGLMLGEFHPASTVGGVHNRDFPVMRCPVPMFAVRVMTPHDLLFADQPGTPPADRLAYLEQFARHVGPRLRPPGQDDLRARLTAARDALPPGDPL